MSRRPTPPSPLFTTAVLIGMEADRPEVQVEVTLPMTPSRLGDDRLELRMPRQQLRTLADDIYRELDRTAEVPATED